MPTLEYNFDGLVGPTHNYAGLSHGNVASQKHQHAVSSPKAAALQGLKKMKFVRDLGVPQCVLPPLPRPNLNFLRTIGFEGDDNQILENAYQVDPVLVAVCFSASSMWTANAATVSPSPDCSDTKLHLTPANLASNLHRSLEGKATTQLLRQIFYDDRLFEVHDPLLSSMALTDEGAANHTRFCPDFDCAGIELFVYGVEFLSPTSVRPIKFPARQTLESCQAIIRRHRLDPSNTIVVQQNPDAIDHGVFHNDVISVGHQNVLLVHEKAFLNQQESVGWIKEKFNLAFGSELKVTTILDRELSLDDAVSSYLFNSQIVTRRDGTMALICPTESEANQYARAATEKVIESDNPIEEVHFLDLRQSMNNGGGPACLRLRVVLSEDQQKAIHDGVVLTDKLYDSLVNWVEKHYRDSLSPSDLLDPLLVVETRDAFTELSEILSIPIFNEPI